MSESLTIPYAVVEVVLSNTAVLLDGLTIADSHANGGGVNNDGGAIHCRTSPGGLLIRNMLFENNTTDGNGVTGNIKVWTILKPLHIDLRQIQLPGITHQLENSSIYLGQRVVKGRLVMRYTILPSLEIAPFLTPNKKAPQAFL